jgi:NDP-sugar pyrophosphorylase family protein
MSKRVVVLAGGKGTRLRPYTVVFPKPLMPIGEYPILEVIVRQLVSAGFDHITMAVNHQADLIKAFFGDGKKWQIKIDYSLEDQPLGTMGPLKIIKDLPPHFLVMNGDILTDLDFAAFYKQHTLSGSIFSVSSSVREQVSDYGVLGVDGNHLLTSFLEKPKSLINVSMGVYMLSREVLNHIPEGKPFGFDQLMLKLIENKIPVKVRAHSGHWLDIGRADDYMKAIDDFENIKDVFLK